jgi:hypothetical protein
MAVVFQPYIGVGFSIILDDNVGRSKMLQKTRVVHGASECLWPKLFRAKVASLMIIMACTAQIAHAGLGLCVIILRAVRVMHLGFRPRLDDPTSHEPISEPARKPFLPLGLPR